MSELQGLVERRLNLLTQIWGTFAERMEIDPSRMRMNFDILTNVVESFYRHLYRYKNDHDINWADQHKSGGFMMHWICSLKPIQNLVFSEDKPANPLEEHEILINELFAIEVGISCLECQSDLIGDFTFFESLVQRLQERECPPQFLSSMLYLYEQLRQSTT